MKSKKFVLAGLVLLAITGLLALAGCKNDSVLEAAAKYTVTFNANGGSEVAPQVVESGNAATKPTDPTKDGWVFAGWYTSADGGKTLTDTAYDFDTPVAGDITLYAAWNGRDSDGTIVLRNKVMSKTSEVQVLSTAVDLASLYNADSNSKIFVENRVDSIQPFVMGQYEVTQQLYFAVMGKNPSNNKTGTENEEPKEGGLPVETVSWYDAVVYCNRRSIAEDLTPCYALGNETDPDEWEQCQHQAMIHGK